MSKMFKEGSNVKLFFNENMFPFIGEIREVNEYGFIVLGMYECSTTGETKYMYVSHSTPVRVIFCDVE